MKPKSIKLKPIIKGHIATFFSMFNYGDQFRTEDVVKYCRRMTGKQMYPDSVIRYMREMRDDWDINYTCICKQDRIIKVLELGEPHSL